MENSIKAIREMILATNGKTFGVKFIKKDGSLRTMSCRLGVKKGVKGTTPVATAKRNATLKESGKMGVYEMYDFQSEETRGFRVINLNTLKEFKFGGRTITFS